MIVASLSARILTAKGILIGIQTEFTMFRKDI